MAQERGERERRRDRRRSAEELRAELARLVRRREDWTDMAASGDGMDYPRALIKRSRNQTYLAGAIAALTWALGEGAPPDETLAGES